MSQVDLELETSNIISALGFEDEIARLKNAIALWIDGANSELQEALRWQFSGSSKYYRPLTVFSCYRALHKGHIPNSVIQAAVGVELFHNMSLVIDDILDRSDERRGNETLHKKFGELQALMASGYIVADGYRTVVKDPYYIELFSELMQRLGAAECLQWRQRRKPLGVEDWRGIAGEDTGSMFEICACLGGHGDKLRKFGALIGLLYHGCDDVADVRGLAGLGGGGTEDLRDGILTLPAALAIRDPYISELFVNGHEADEETILEAYKEKIPESEDYLDSVQLEAEQEAELFATDPEGLIALTSRVRKLSTT